MSDSTSAPATGQASASEQPQAGQSSSNAPQAGGSNSAQTRSSADYEREIAELRKESAASRTKLNAYEKAEADRQAASMSELDKANKKAADTQKLYEDQMHAYQDLMTGHAIRDAARDLSVNPDLAERLVERSAIEMTDGKPTNIRALLEAAIKQYGLTPGAQSGQTGQPPRPAAQSGGATNPGAAARGVVFTPEQIRGMTPAQYRANRDAIMAQVERNRHNQ